MLRLNISIASKHYCNLLSRALKGYLLISLYKQTNLENLCFLFGKELVYWARGVITILDHLQGKSLVEKYILKINFSLPGQSTSSCTYGLHPMCKEFVLPEKTLPVNSNIPFSGRIIHMEGMVLSFIAEYSLPFSSARNIVELAKEMMHDPKAANKLQVARQTALYKMQHSLAKGLEKQLIDKFRKRFFSFNINEATSLNLHKVHCWYPTFVLQKRKLLLNT